MTWLLADARTSAEEWVTGDADLQVAPRPHGAFPCQDDRVRSLRGRGRDAGVGLPRGDHRRATASGGQATMGEPIARPRHRGARQRRRVVVEVKRTLDRTQLAQGLEYAGWAMQASLETLASLYAKQHPGRDFFQAWGEWSGSSTIEVLSSSKPRLILVAGSFHDDTWSAIAFTNAAGEMIETRSHGPHRRRRRNHRGSARRGTRFGTRSRPGGGGGGSRISPTSLWGFPGGPRRGRVSPSRRGASVGASSSGRSPRRGGPTWWSWARDGWQGVLERLWTRRCRLGHLQRRMDEVDGRA